MPHRLREVRTKFRITSFEYPSQSRRTCFFVMYSSLNKRCPNGSVVVLSNLINLWSSYAFSAILLTRYLTRSTVSNVFLNISWLNLACANLFGSFCRRFCLPLARTIDYSFGLRAQNSCIGIPASTSLNVRTSFVSIYHKVGDLLENLRGQNGFEVPNFFPSC